MQHQQFAIVSGGELPGGRLPESRFFQFVAVIQHGAGVKILNRKMRAAGAFDFPILIVGRELVGSGGLNRDELTDPRIGDSGSVEGDQQGTMAGVKIAGIEREGNALLFLILPVEAAIGKFITSRLKSPLTIKLLLVGK